MPQAVKDPGERLLLSHLHEEMLRKLDAVPLEVAKDGLRVEL